jgi:YesN/AraC family two-component response regulator
MITARRTILIVDDEQDMLDFLERVFRAGWIVLRAASAAQALAVLDEHKVDAVITDQKMPKQSGVELLEAICDRGLDIVKIILSGYADVLDVQRAIARCGIHQYVLKPVDSERLRALVEQAFENRAAGRTAVLDTLP